MKKNFLVIVSSLLAFSAGAQRMHVGVFGGLAAYNGDLTTKIFPKKVTNGAIGVTLNYELTDHAMLRGGVTYTVVGGADKYSDDEYARSRNLSFETSILEFSAVGEYYLLNINETRYSPYGFAGLAIFHFNPYTYTAAGEKVYLKPLSTEGQGINGYPDRKPYSLTQIAFPIGGGFKFAITENLRIGLEGGLRKLLTDYLDDASTNYIDPNDLLAAKGQLALDLSYRGDELAGGNPNYPSKLDQRGSPKKKDIYYFAGLHVTYRLGNGGGGGLFGGGGHGGRKSKTGCPVNVY